mgnify:FL=1
MLPAYLRPAFPDAGRFVVQHPVLQSITAARPLSGRVLNAGCGEGLYAPWIASFPDVTRIEHTDIAVGAAMPDVFPRPRHAFTRASLTALPYASERFDAVVCTEVIEHIPDDAAAVRELARVVKAGGTLIASVPHRPAPADPNHAHADYSVAEFRALLEGAGWHVEAHAVCCHALLRLVMVYWRHPLIRAGGTGNPYLPRFVLHGLAHLDRRVRLGRPWDLVVRATKR